MVLPSDVVQNDRLGISVYLIGGNNLKHFRCSSFDIQPDFHRTVSSELKRPICLQDFCAHLHMVSINRFKSVVCVVNIGLA